MSRVRHHIEPLYTQAEVDRANAEHGAKLLREERERIRAWVFHHLGKSPDGNKMLDDLDTDNWPPGSSE